MNTMPENKPRKPWIAVVLTIIVVGLGHIYSGEKKKGIALYLCQAVIPLVTIPIIIAKTNIYSFILALILGLSYFIYCIVDVLKISRAKKDTYQLEKYNKWYIYLALYAVATFIIHPTATFIIRENTIQAFKIPSGAMQPTLMVGDRIVVNRFTYKISKPQRGDIIVFKYPVNPSINYVKRLVGIPGDTVELKDKKLFINNIERAEIYIVNSDPNIYSSETNPRDNYGPITVPENSFFVMGDNRDNSHDSRYWGFANQESVLGKVVNIYWSWDTKTKNVRWGRIGKSTEIQ